MNGILLYCITDRLDQDLFEILGMDGKGKLYSIEDSGMFAIVSNISLEEYGEEAIAEKGEDINWLKEKAVLFMDIILKINAITNMIPMKFLTIFTSDDRVRNIINENYNQFLHNFEKIKNRDEISLKIYCDENKYKEKVMGEEIKKFENSIIGKPKGAAFFLKKKFEGELDDKIQNRICNAANQMTEKVSNLANQIKLNKLLAKEITGIPTQMILNCAFLIDRDKKDIFTDKINELKDEFENNGFVIELSGPWPPFSFCE